MSNIKFLALLAVLVFALPMAYAQASAQASYAVQMYVYSPVSQPIGQVSYSITVPNFPAVQQKAGYEFHLGIQSGDGKTFMKTTISYGCTILPTTPCQSPYLNRYTFYVSVINQTSTDRIQYPSNGYIVTRGSTYNITMQLNNNCGQDSWQISLVNSTNSYTFEICGTMSYLQNKNFTTLGAGFLELHNIKSCSEMPNVNRVVQSNIDVLSTIGQTETVNQWGQYFNPFINCQFKDTVSGNTVTESWIS